MKALHKAVFILIIAIALGTGAYYGYGFYKGIKPAIFPPEDKNIINSKKNAENNLGLSLPEGFKISIFAENLKSPRVIIWDKNETMLTSITSEGKIIALPDKNKDGKSDEKIEILSGLNQPHGIAFRCENEKCKLYTAEQDKISIYDYDANTIKAENGKKIIDLPKKGGHYTRTIIFGPDNLLYISIGSSCNVCLEEDSRRAKIFTANPDGSDLKVFSSGLRNAVFMAINPITNKIFATEMGRDHLGDNTPPDEVNIIEKEKNYGWPICYGKNVHDNEFDKNTYIRNPCMEPFETPSHIDIPAHSAPLGLAFKADNSWGEEYNGSLFIAYHGSWNRTSPAGYKIVRFKKANENGDVSKTSEDFITGWLKADGKSSGRPADIKIANNGAVYISDDKAGIIYKVDKK